jgi:signal transduction histidine kinase
VIPVLSDADGSGLYRERVLGRARLILAGASLAALYVDPTRPLRYAVAAYALLAAYVIASVVYLIVVTEMQSLPARLPFIAHVFDAIWLALLTLLTGASSSPLFPFFTFIVLAAAFRWGYRETLATTLVLVWIILAETVVLVTSGWLVAGSAFELNLFLVRISYMAITGVLLAFLASHQKRLQMESALVARILSRLRSETTLDAALETTGHELLRAFGARSLAIAVRETRGVQTMLWTLNADDEEMQRTPLSPAEAEDYLAKAPAAFVLKHRRSTFGITAVRKGSVGYMPTTLAPAQPFNTALVASALYEDHWFGRLFVYEPSRRMGRVDALRLLARVVEFIAPALHSVFLIRRLRSRSEASERARLARELHDTSVQSLIGLEMEVMALSRKTTDSSLRSAIDDVHSRLQYEIRALRNLMAHLNKGAGGTPSITERLTEMLARFQVDTGIRARLLTSAALAAPPRIGLELTRLVEAALSNVRRHSGASYVDVTLERHGDGWLLVIEDDGVAGRDGGRQPLVTPWSMRERVTALGGQLVVEPRDDVGVRVEIRLPAFVLSA